MKTTLLVPVLLLAACGSDKTDADYKADVVTSMHDSIAADLADLAKAARDLQAAAPTASRGWSTTEDAAAITAMKDAWRRCRIAYEHVEGAAAPIFPDLDASLDARYDDFLAMLGTSGDSDLFDAHGVTGMHAIERILFSDQISSKVTAFESMLPGYQPAQFPQDAAASAEIETGLFQKLVDDADTLAMQWQPAAIDIGASFQGLVALMNEQKEKVDKASTGEEESRYAQSTLFDLRNNLEGTQTIYDIFHPWIETKQGGGDADTMIVGGFTTLSQLYVADPGDALPEPPTDWSSDMPSAADLATPFGMLWQSVHQAVDPNRSGSVVFEMNTVATMLGFPEFVEQ